MKHIILVILELFVISMSGVMADRSSDLNFAEELKQLKEETTKLTLKIAEQKVSSAKQNELIMEQNAKIANQDRLIMEQNAKIANQDRLIMEHRMSNAVQGNSVLQTQNNLLERSLSTMQQWNDQREELLSKMSLLETFNETVIEFATHEYQDIRKNLQQWDDQHGWLLSQIARLETLNETIMDISQNQLQDKKVPVVAFGASLSEEFTARRDKVKIVFDNIQTNEGNSYHNGIFTAPVPGLYIFQWTILTTHGKICDSILVVNSIWRRQNAANSVTPGNFGYKSGSASIPLRLKKGDKVWIIVWSSGNYVYGDDFSSFQGWIQNTI